MHFLINGRFLSQRVTGVQRYAREVVQGLDELLQEGRLDPQVVSIEVLVPSGIENLPDYKHISIRTVGTKQGHLWEQWELPRAAKGQLLLNLGNTAPLLKKNQCVTIHDVSIYAVPEAYSKPFIAWYKLQFQQLSKRLSKIITVSEFSKGEMIRYLKTEPDKLQVTYEGKEHIERIECDDSILENPLLKGKSYVLAVSSLSPHKNFGAVVKALEHLKDCPDLSVVIIGGGNQQVFAEINLADNEQVIRPGYVSDGQLKSLYQNAMGFIHASYYEGFGLTPLEAMTCGCPVLVSKAAAMPEVCEDAALYFDPHQPEDIAQQVRTLINDETLRQQLRAKSLKQADKFSWQKCAWETYQVMESIAAE